MGHKINDFYALIVEVDGHELFVVEKNSHIPTLVDKTDHLFILKNIAHEFMKREGKPVTLVKFSMREDIENFEPAE